VYRAMIERALDNPIAPQSWGLPEVIAPADVPVTAASWASRHSGHGSLHVSPVRSSRDISLLEPRVAPPRRECHQRRRLHGDAPGPRHWRNARSLEDHLRPEAATVQRLQRASASARFGQSMVEVAQRRLTASGCVSTSVARDCGTERPAAPRRADLACTEREQVAAGAQDATTQNFIAMRLELEDQFAPIYIKAERARCRRRQNDDQVKGLHNFAMPVDVTWKATNPHGLAPAGDHAALAQTCGARSVVRGYAGVPPAHCSPGRCVKRIPPVCSDSLRLAVSGSIQAFLQRADPSLALHGPEDTRLRPRGLPGATTAVLTFGTERAQSAVTQASHPGCGQQRPGKTTSQDNKNRQIERQLASDATPRRRCKGGEAAAAGGGKSAARAPYWKQMTIIHGKGYSEEGAQGSIRGPSCTPTLVAEHVPPSCKALETLGIERPSDAREVRPLKLSTALHPLRRARKFPQELVAALPPPVGRTPLCSKECFRLMAAKGVPALNDSAGYYLGLAGPAGGPAATCPPSRTSCVAVVKTTGIVENQLSTLRTCATSRSTMWRAEVRAQKSELHLFSKA
uniref:SH2 domain-containing protein n=1 Tax=Macrostomum lignano TaxID=282301 RepID=A0A1I8FA29_9PLAT